MMKEIERKFLLTKMPEIVLQSTICIRQGYISKSRDSVEIRLRQKGDAFFMTFKRGQGLVRDEAEIRINEADFDYLWPLTQGRQVEKHRSQATLEDGLTVEIDEFSGTLAGLFLCEVEFGDETQARTFVPPQWFGADVTEDSRYKNKSLAENGIPEN
ncbi:CYTH domain-containing protein [Desulfobacter postgatei]|jgi:CYTH domain-containing protein|nr:CYTH domain-containing protein [Desulfobacter postgatei]MDD4273268.1 CYTH domain-containing protein [Desulfobacter postgatei]MDX9964382.1 CYTH domain-containing protein [Desulfobacter postgatei]